MLTWGPPVRFPLDGRLRSAGFAVYRRSGRGPVLWRRGGRVYTELEAAALAAAEAETDAAAGKPAAHGANAGR